MFLGTGVSGVAIIQVSNATANSGLETLEGDVTGALNTFAQGSELLPSSSSKLVRLHHHLPLNPTYPSRLDPQLTSEHIPRRQNASPWVVNSRKSQVDLYLFVGILWSLRVKKSVWRFSVVKVNLFLYERLGPFANTALKIFFVGSGLYLLRSIMSFRFNANDGLMITSALDERIWVLKLFLLESLKTDQRKSDG